VYPKSRAQAETTHSSFARIAESGQELERNPALLDRAEEGAGTDAVVEVARDPLAEEVACAFRLDGAGVREDVGTVDEGLSLGCFDGERVSWYGTNKV
jgi:hypothetical protein